MASIKGLRAISDEYKEGKEIGKGTYGLVHMCAHVGTPHEQNLVIKKINLAKMKRKEIADLVKEAKLLGMFNHPNIVKLRDYFITPEHLCIVQEFCSAKDLAYEVKLMRKTKKLFPEDVIWTWFLQISAAVKHIHDRKILHRDIKTANIFLHLEDPQGWPVCRLGDFGISKGACGRTDASLCCRLRACDDFGAASPLAPADSACAPPPFTLDPRNSPRGNGGAGPVARGHAVLHEPGVMRSQALLVQERRVVRGRGPVRACLPPSAVWCVRAGMRAHNEHCKSIATLFACASFVKLCSDAMVFPIATPPRHQGRARCASASPDGAHAHMHACIYTCAHTELGEHVCDHAHVSVRAENTQRLTQPFACSPL
jgi:hypothetical protein